MAQLTSAIFHCIKQGLRLWFGGGARLSTRAVYVYHILSIKIQYPERLFQCGLPLLFTMAVASMYLFAVVLLLAYYLFKRTVSVLHRRQLTRDNRCKPLKALPQSEDIFGIGHTLKVIRNRAKKHFLDSVFEYFGDGFWTFSVTILGAPWIETIEAENVKYILSTKFEDFDIAPMRLRSFFPLMGAGIFTTDGAQWAHSRAVLRPSFNKSQLAEFELLETHTRNFLAHVPGDDSRIDLKPLCFCFTMDVSTDFLFGQSSFSLLAKSTGAEGDLDPISEAFNYSQQKIFTRTFLGPISTLFDAKFRRSNKIVHDFVDTFVRDALESHDSSMMKKNGRVEEGQFIFLKELVKDCQDPVQLRYHLVHILQAGRDTSACLIANTLFALANNPEVWAKLQEEVQTLKGKIPTYEDLKDMRYLKHVLQECKSCRALCDERDIY